MDVILDSNVILEDVVFERAQFKELFAYLKRTNSRMVLPMTVRDEVEARFKERLSKSLNEATRAWGEVKRLSGGSYPILPSVDVSRAINAMRARMQCPNPKVPQSLFPGLEEIDLAEVVRRGIERRRPASPEGEELRDVVVWLHVKRYAAERQSEIAFITRDLGFRGSKGEQALHPDLAAELAEEGLSVSFHPDIGSFIRGHALTERPITEEWLSRFLRIADLRGIATAMLLAKGAAYGTVEQAEIESVQLRKGAEYEVARNSSYVEATYKGTGTLRVVPSLWGAYSHPTS